jgi:hypothetical protein
VVSVVATAWEDEGKVDDEGEERHGVWNPFRRDRRDAFGAGVVVTTTRMAALVMTVSVDVDIADAGTEGKGTTARFPSDASITNLFIGGWKSNGRSVVGFLAVVLVAAVMSVLSVAELVTGGVS